MPDRKERRYRCRVSPTAVEVFHFHFPFFRLEEPGATNIDNNINRARPRSPSNHPGPRCGKRVGKNVFTRGRSKSLRFIHGESLNGERKRERSMHRTWYAEARTRPRGTRARYNGINKYRPSYAIADESRLAFSNQCTPAIDTANLIRKFLKCL